MSAVQKIFQIYGPRYLALYGDRMPEIHKKVIRDIIDCRRGPFGNRHCPNCQHDKAEKWLRKQMEKLLPTHYFLLTITLPQGLREIARSHQKTVYNALFSCAHEAL